MPSKLSPEDQARVDRVLSRGLYRVERKPFKVWTLFLVLLLILIGMSGASWFIAWYYGVV